MKKSIYIISAAISLLIVACEKEIQLDLKPSGTKYVLEGVVTDQPGPTVVTVSQTKGFSADNQFPAVTGAIVTISDNNGPEILLGETTPGRYENATITGVPGHTYAMKVTIGEQVFTAKSTMPAVVKFDSLYVTKELLGVGDRLVSNVVYQDPPQRGNGYRCIETINGKRTRFLFVQNDDLTNGRKVTNQLRNFDENDNDRLMAAGDTVMVEMHGIDPAVYLYWFSLQAASGRSDDGTPANPVSNIKGGALGYFSAHNVQTKTITVPGNL